MRKFYLINALMLLLTLFSSAGISAAVTTYPYSPDFKSDDGWTKTTTGNGSWSRFSGYWQATFYSGNSKAYLFSPELQTESGAATLLHIHWKRVVQGTQMKNSQSIF